MATQKNPFADYAKMFGNYKAPVVDMTQMFSIGRRNAEALSAASSVVAQSAQSASRVQAESIRGNVEVLLKATKEMMAGGSPEINSTKQAELSKVLFDASLQNFRDASESMTKSFFEASDVLNRRASESMDEIKKASKAA